MAGKHDITLFQGASLSFDITLENDDGTNQGIAVPVNLSDAVVHMQIRQNFRTQDIMLDVGAEGYIWIEDATAGKIKVDIPGFVTNDIYIRTTAVYDIVVDFGYGNVIRPLQGLVNFSPKATQVENYLYEGVTPQ